MTVPYALAVAAAGSEQPWTALVVEDRAAPLSRLATHGEVGGHWELASILARWPVAQLELHAFAESAADERRWHQVSISTNDLRFRPPVPEGARLFAAAANYWGHIEQLTVVQRPPGTEALDEEGARLWARQRLQERLDHGDPYLFVAVASAISGAADNIVLVDDGIQHDWEAELAVIFGATAHDVPRDAARTVIAGYSICNDLTIRDRVFAPDAGPIGADWLRAKGRPGYFPLGPTLVPDELVADPMNLSIRLRLNGELMQDANTSDMVFDIGRLVEYLTSIVEIRPGDVLITGSPAGNGAHHGRFLTAGDVIETSIEGLGTQRNRCVTANGAHSQPGGPDAAEP